jgi:hypothetical protein
MKINPPGQNVPIQLPDGTMDPLWYAFLTQKRNLLDGDDVDNATTAITNGQVLLWNTAAKKFKPGAN